ncbi:flagellar hook-basal body complex protein FliE [Carnobacterium funditum]|uniref:flagellar hook-basal body complex protein FliE n=1 Tax=Carnobacterium funditum TaxID=2752 RepID=UPI000552E74A|nr:flagellar hook-basal body complex protein FliE [Carnobacterium funditum]
MNIEKLSASLLTGVTQPATPGIKTQETTASGSFAGMIEQAMGNLNDKQLAADQAVQSLAAGDADNLHTVMIRTSEAQLTLDLALQIRNKGLEAYNEVKNMQF